MTTTTTSTEHNGIHQLKAQRVFKGAVIRIQPAADEDIDVETQDDSTGKPFLDKLVEILNPAEIKEPVLWRAAAVEAFASAVLTFMSSCSVRTSINSPMTFPPTAIAIFNGALLTLLIYAAAAPSGGHINPLITLSTLATGLTSPMRALLYVPAQLLGSALGSFFFRLGLGLWGVKTTVAEMAGCVIPDDMDLSQAFAIEFASSFLIFIVGFGCAIDPVASRVYGPIYAPLLIGVAVGLIIFGTSALVPGYTGAGVNPARCFGPVLVSNDGWKEFWAVFAAAPVVASIVHAPVYRTAPPDHAQ